MHIGTQSSTYETHQFCRRERLSLLDTAQAPRRAQQWKPNKKNRHHHIQPQLRCTRSCPLRDFLARLIIFSSPCEQSLTVPSRKLTDHESCPHTASQHRRGAAKKFSEEESLKWTNSHRCSRWGSRWFCLCLHHPTEHPTALTQRRLQDSSTKLRRITRNGFMNYQKNRARGIFMRVLKFI